MQNQLITHVQYFRDEGIAGLDIRPAELRPERLDLHEDCPDVHGRAGVLHQIVHGREIIQLYSLEIIELSNSFSTYTQHCIFN